MITGKNINLRYAHRDDAEFILTLRLDPNLNKFLSVVKNDISQQRRFIQECSNIHNEYYFVIENKMLNPVGTIRIYNIREKVFCWGSWIVKPEARKYATFESIFLLYQYAFITLGLDLTRFDVRKNNKKALNFYLRFGAVIYDETEEDLLMMFTKEDFYERKDYCLHVINKIIGD